MSEAKRKRDSHWTARRSVQCDPDCSVECVVLYFQAITAATLTKRVPPLKL